MDRNTNIVGPCVAENVIQRVRLRHIFAGLADDDGQLDLVVGQVLVDWLSDLGNSDWRVRSNQGRHGLIEKNGKSGPNGQLEKKLIQQE